MSELLNALRRNLAGMEEIGDEANVKLLRKRIATEEANEPAPADAELEALRTEAEAAGVTVDRRWKADRLRDEIAAAAEAADKEQSAANDRVRAAIDAAGVPTDNKTPAEKPSTKTKEA